MRNEGAVTAITAKRLTLALCAAGVVGGAVGALAVNHNNVAAETAPAAVAAPLQAVAPAPAPAAGTPAATVTLPDFTRIAANHGKAVVNIQVRGGTKTANRGNAPQVEPGHPLYDFFRQFQDPRFGGGRGAPTFGAGSGFIVSPDGVILTNAHVVQGADEVTVKLQDRREFRAKVLGTDPRTDVAVLKIDAKNLPVAPVGKSRSLLAGEWVLAIGSPYGLESTVTAGVVSATGRSLQDGVVPFIQTDVAVNPGNSGGPLFNTRGEVVGINSQIYSQTGGYQGLSFAIPIDVAVKIKDQIVATGKVQHAKLGVSVQEVGQAFADSFRLESPEGALISSVERGGPAERAGLKSGDVIRRVNGTMIVSSGDLPSIIALARPGERVALDVWRDGKLVRVDATLGDAAEKTRRPQEELAAAPDNSARLGLALRPLEPIERRQSGIASGLVIEETSGAAAIAGVEPGDVLISVNGRAVNSLDQVRDVVAKASKSVALLIQRGSDRIFIPVRIG
ncbi:Do family serine endopeptidase [Telluria aromaticivorans]|uniref:Probable periplasmic serine endoprotease DegP-like n=1 Tax=Telluria aromaticivorans TaxID=2725995 RepID=A0A7Y2JXH0_9BURK|nr:Do family serine endopeptidase [Telluria aromaticivorans]NNG22508.1 Do family serine endopeptidase [Telluria aromaticivorans]